MFLLYKACVRARECCLGCTHRSKAGRYPQGNTRSISVSFVFLGLRLICITISLLQLSRVVRQLEDETGQDNQERSKTPRKFFLPVSKHLIICPTVCTHTDAHTHACMHACTRSPANACLGHIDRSHTVCVCVCVYPGISQPLRCSLFQRVTLTLTPTSTTWLRGPPLLSTLPRSLPPSWLLCR